MTKAQFSAAPFDQMIQDQFAAAMELAFSQVTVDPLPPGHISLEEKARGGTYAKWRRLGADGKPASPGLCSASLAAPLTRQHWHKKKSWHELIAQPNSCENWGWLLKITRQQLY
jgi:hypothetical protein